MDDALSIEPATLRGAGAVKRFRISSEVALAPLHPRSSAPGPGPVSGPSAPGTAPLPGYPAAPSAKRGLVSIIGRKMLKVLVYPVTDALLGPVTADFIRRWEEKNRPYALRRFAATDQGPLDANDWARLASGPALLFIHGTFSTSRSAFGALSEATLQALNKRYEGRVFAFDHPSLHVNPAEKIRWFLTQVPPGTRLRLDVICHSRGGLVTRCLADRLAMLGGDAERYDVRRAVMVGVPNRGTLLTEPDHMVDLLDRMTTALNLFPDGGVSDVLESVLAVVKVIGHAGLVHLEGLGAMNPSGKFLGGLNAPPASSCTYFAIGADFEPAAAGLNASFGIKVADHVMDRVFENATNDLVVPTDGTYGDNGHPGFPLPAERYFSFAAQQQGSTIEFVRMTAPGWKRNILS